MATSSGLMWLQLAAEELMKILFCLYLQLSILVHPDKNQDDEERAQKAFEGTSYLCNTALSLCLLVSPADNLGKQF